MSAPLSRALRHSERCEEYSPSRRSSTPRAATSAASYPASMSSLNWAVNDRRRGRSERGVIVPILGGPNRQICSSESQCDQACLALCGREKVLPEVSHISLTHRVIAVHTPAVAWCSEAPGADGRDRPWPGRWVVGCWAAALPGVQRPVTAVGTRWLAGGACGARSGPASAAALVLLGLRRHALSSHLNPPLHRLAEPARARQVATSGRHQSQHDQEGEGCLTRH